MKKITFLLLLCIYVVTSCNEPDLYTESDIKDSKQINYKVTKEEAVLKAVKALSTLRNISDIETTFSFRSDDLEISNISYYVSDKTRNIVANDTLFYLLNFKDGGFVIVSSDSRASEIYALSSDNSISIDDNPSVAYYLDMASDYMLNEIASVSILPILPRPDGDDPSMFIITEYGGQNYYTQYHDWITTSPPFTLLSTSWNQSSPYNNNCFTDNAEQAVAGCVPIAVAQIMGYHKKPTSFNKHPYKWDEILRYSYVPNYTPSAQSVAFLVNDIGINANTKYGIEKSSNKAKDVLLVLKNFGYQTSSQLNNYSDKLAINDLNKSLPIYISGVDKSNNGHAWVLDGYYSQQQKISYYSLDTKKIYISIYQDRTYLHCNWGWSSGNGYFLSGAFGDFNSSLSLLTNIRYMN